MASIASPRLVPASGASTPTVSSRRTSLDTTRTASPARAPAPSGAQTRRNRTALRDYYNLKSTSPASSSTAGGVSAGAGEEDGSGPSATTSVAESELDQPGFSAAGHVAALLEREGLAAVLRAEGALLNEIRELDGDRKALVYDNYSKLIAATDTIRGMRSNMAPLGDSTGDLKRMVDQIAATASELMDAAVDKKKLVAGTAGGSNGGDPEAAVIEQSRAVEEEKELKARQKKTVRWVVESPRRFKGYISSGERSKAEKEWEKVKRLLDKWEKVEGAAQVRSECEALFEQDDELAAADTDA